VQLRQAERGIISYAFEVAGCDLPATAVILGISAVNLTRRVKILELQPTLVAQAQALGIEPKLPGMQRQVKPPASKPLAGKAKKPTKRRKPTRSHGSSGKEKSTAHPRVTVEEASPPPAVEDLDEDFVKDRVIDPAYPTPVEGAVGTPTGCHADG
jgi:hypothetical protein